MKKMDRILPVLVMQLRKNIFFCLHMVFNLTMECTPQSPIDITNT